MEPLILVVNPGSSSRKYALFRGEKKIATLHFESASGEIVGAIVHEGQKHLIDNKTADFGSASGLVLPLLHEHGVIEPDDKIGAIGLRIVAPSHNFARDQLITSTVEQQLEVLVKRAPLHITTALSEIKKLRKFFEGVPIVEISDSAFHDTKPDWAKYYGIDTELADKHEIVRFGYHGISVQSVVDYLKSQNKLMEKTIVCHLGSGSSITAVMDGKSVETTMGYTPLEGLMMATRSGSMDVSAALAVKRALNLDDEGLEEYLNKKSGLGGVSGSTNEILELLDKEKDGDEKSKLALKMFVYRIQLAIGQMAASMGGVNCLVFTATIGERSAPIRGRVLEGLEYLGFITDKTINEATFEPKTVTNIGTAESKPVLVVATDESQEIARRVNIYLNSIV